MYTVYIKYVALNDFNVTDFLLQPITVSPAHAEIPENASTTTLPEVTDANVQQGTWGPIVETVSVTKLTYWILAAIEKYIAGMGTGRFSIQLWLNKNSEIVKCLDFTYTSTNILVPVNFKRRF